MITISSKYSKSIVILILIILLLIVVSFQFSSSIKTWKLPSSSKVIAFSPDGKLLASAGKDSTIKLWRMPPGNSWPWLFGTGSLIAFGYWQRAYLLNWFNQ